MICLNISKQLGVLIEYIESNLTEDIDYAYMAQIIGTNVDTLNRLFPILNNVSLSEYIRKRRLTKAGRDLLNGEKVIDVAVKYRYNSSTSFAVAFENMHGIKPSKVFGNANSLKNYPPISFGESVFSTMPEYRFLEAEEFSLYGYSQRMKLREIRHIAPGFWSEMAKKYSEVGSASKNYGIIHYIDGWENVGVDYYVATDGEFENATEIVVPASKWIIFNMKDLHYSLIPTITNNAKFKYFESENYSVKNTISLEVYYHDEERIEIWIQID